MAVQAAEIMRGVQASTGSGQMAIQAVQAVQGAEIMAVQAVQAADRERYRSGTGSGHNGGTGGTGSGTGSGTGAVQGAVQVADSSDRQRYRSGDPNIIQEPSCISVGGNSPITDSCNNTAISNNTNSGGNIGTGNGPSGSGNRASGPSIRQAPVECISVGGNSPITGSCTNSAISNNTNSGGNIGTGNGPSGSGNRASGPSIRQAPVCMSVGGNSPITGSCVNGGTIMNINTGGTVHSNSGRTSTYQYSQYEPIQSIRIAAEQYLSIMAVLTEYPYLLFLNLISCLNVKLTTILINKDGTGSAPSLILEMTRIYLALTRKCYSL